MSVTTNNELVQRARFLRNAAPQAFLDFYAALSAYADDQYAVMVETTDNLKRAQGHAQQCKKLLKLLEAAKNG